MTSVAAAAGAEQRRLPRLAGSDLVRAVAMIGVVCIHASAWGPRAPFASVDLISRFSVPAFMVLTGLLLAYQYSDRPLGVAFMRRRLGRSVLPWLAWVPVYIVFNLVTGMLPARGASVLSFLEYGGGHLWFLLLIPQFYALFAMWPRRACWLVAIAAVLVQTFLCAVRIYTILPGWQSQVTLSFATEIFPFWIGYFAVGVAAGRTLARRAAAGRPLAAVPAGWRAPAVIGGALAVAASGYLLLNVRYAHAPYAPSFLGGTGAFLNPVLPLFVFSVVAWLFVCAPLAMSASRAVARGVRLLSDQSLGLYIVHPILLWCIGRLLVGGVDSGGALSAAAFCAFVMFTVLATLLVVIVLSATPLALTLGTPRRGLRLPQRPRGSGIGTTALPGGTASTVVTPSE